MKTIFLILFLIRTVLCQVNIDQLLGQYYETLVKEPQRLHYECFSVDMFPFFASNESKPPLKDKDKFYDNFCSFYKFKDLEGVHLIFSGLSYLKRKGNPVYKTYRLFFYIKKDGKWVLEMEPLVVRFKLTNEGTYEPI